MQDSCDTTLSAETLPVTSRCRLRAQDLPEKYRLDLWRHVMEREFNLSFEARSDTSLSAELDLLQLGSYAIGKLSTNPVTHTVTQRQLEGARADVLFFILKQGRLHLDLRDRSVTVGPGDAMAYRINEARSLHFLDNDTVGTWVTMPAMSVGDIVPDLDDTLARPIAKDARVVRLLDDYAAMLVGFQRPMTLDFISLVTRHMSELVATGLQGSLASGPLTYHSGTNAARKRAIKEHIVKNLGNTDLSSEDVAARLGISTRYLRDLLRKDGTTFTDLVRQMRLQQAYRLLSDPKNIGLTVLGIAYEVGFNDLSYFYRAFREKYGVAPAKFRRDMFN